MKKITIGIIGGGNFGTEVFKGFIKAYHQGLIEKIVLCDLNENIREKHKKYFFIQTYSDYKKMIDKEDLDAISIVTPDHLHYEVTKYVAKKKLHIMV